MNGTDLQAQVLNSEDLYRKRTRAGSREKQKLLKKNHFTLMIRGFHSDPSPQKKKASLTDPRVNRRVAEVKLREERGDGLRQDGLRTD